jgi:Ca2+-binding RTX toxin-like protein
MTVVHDYTALLSGLSWSGNGETRAPVVITYSFEQAPQDYLLDSQPEEAVDSWRAFNSTEKNLAISAMKQISAQSGIRFVEAKAGTGDIRFGKVNFDYTDAPDATGFAYYPSRFVDKDGSAENLIGGDVFINTQAQANQFLLLHEIGHAVGLKHPFEGDRTLALELDSHDHTVMSYTGRGTAARLQHLDIDALRSLYGSSTPADGTLEKFSFNSASQVLTQVWGERSSTIAGTGIRDNINAGAGNDIVAGMNGNDILKGGSGSDRLFGGAGNDVLDGGSGDDYIFGGNHQYDYAAGNDTVDYGDSRGAVTIRLEGGTANGSSIGHDRLYDIDNVNGGRGNDDMSGNSLTNLFRGDSGADALRGLGGDDELRGGNDKDRLWGGDGNDRLFGEASSDTLDGGSGDDRLDGGTGTDRLTGGTGRDSFTFAAGYFRDVVTDFENNLDTIRLDRDLWGGGLSITEVLEEFARQSGANVILDFGDGDTLTVANVAAISHLANDILLV